MRSRLAFPFHRWQWRRWLLGCALVVSCGGGIVACDGVADAPNAADPPPETSTAPAPEPAAPPPPPDAAFLALVTPDQTAQIRALGLPLVLPTAIPAGFGVAQVQTQPDERFAGYQILYRGGGVPAGSPAENRCFLIEFTVGGIGGTPATENRQPLNPPLLDEETAEYGLHYGPYRDSALREQFPDPLLISDWLPVEGGFVRFAGAALINNTLTPPMSCRNIEVEAAIAIIDSLAVISDEIQGDGVPAE